MSAVDARRHTFTFKIESAENGSFLASVVHEASRRQDDDVGALYYVVAVIFIYGLSILMMIASYIRKNKMDRKLNRYLKEMANVRKRETQLQLFNAAAKAAAHTQGGSIAIPASYAVNDVSKKQSISYSDASEPDTDLEDSSRTLRPYNRTDYNNDKKKDFLDVPTPLYATDSDNETSTEGDPLNGTKPQKSILKNPRKSVTLVLPGCQMASVMLTGPLSQGGRSQVGETSHPVPMVADTAVAFYYKDELQVVSSV